MTTQRYFKIFFRLSIVVGVIAGLVDANNIRQNYVVDRLERLELVMAAQRAFECALTLKDVQLDQIRNESGLYDVAAYGCGVGIDGKTYFISDEELAQHKNGTYFLTNGDFLEPNGSITDWRSNIATFGIALVALNLIAVGVYLLFILSKWIFK